MARVTSRDRESDESEWSGAANAVECFLRSTPPAESFTLKPAVRITDPAQFWNRLRGDIAAGPGVARVKRRPRQRRGGVT